jgi:lipoprotein-anchoring transpeptidase ErfK/SrfK
MSTDREALAAPGYRTLAGAATQPRFARRRVRPLLPLAIASVALLFAAAVGFVALGWTSGVVFDAGAAKLAAAESGVPADVLANRVREQNRLQRAIERLRPRGLYVTVDMHRNQLRLLRDDEVLREAVVSTGSGAVLRDPRDGREWIFDTPLGERRVQKKVQDPIWYKPDWAFVEEGLVPPKDPGERTDDFSLGEYALYLGDGYLIHGTLFQSLLGTSVTHGCVRVGDDDLEYLYRHVPVGTKVLLF